MTISHAKPSGRRLGTLVKVRFELRDTPGDAGTETLWAEVVGPGRYQLQNSPFYAYGVSFCDVVSAVPPTEQDDAFGFGSVLEPGGHSTYRILLRQGVDLDAFRHRWRDLEVLGCTYESASDRLYSVDVPPHADVHSVYRFLEDGQASDVWDFEEGRCGHIVKS